jgi:hypothetical protein
VNVTDELKSIQIRLAGSGVRAHGGANFKDV